MLGWRALLVHAADERGMVCHGMTAATQRDGGGLGSMVRW